MSKVYFADSKTDESLLKKLSKLFSKVVNFIGEDELTAIKIHFGDYGNTAFLRPIFARQIVEDVKKAGGKPFLTDTNTLYVRNRHDSVNHLTTAIKNGFSYATVDAPIIIADGIRSQNQREIEINKKHFKTAKIAADVADVENLIVVSHTKGHMEAGFGGALKNSGMGCATRAGKQQQHSDIKPNVNESCIGCMKCSTYCPSEAIKKVNGKAVIDPKLCIGCAECIAVCPTHSVDINWETKDFQEKLAEYAYAVLSEKIKGKKVAFFNFLLTITPDCDCFDWSDKAIVPDIGILASTDPVALDKASFDLINKAKGIGGSRLKNADSKNKFLDIHNVDANVQFIYAEKLGLGSTDYELEKI